MKVILGLGNPGIDYVGTRHNAGVVFVDKIFSIQYSVLGGYGWRKHYDALVYKTSNLVLVKTKDIFMNESGKLIFNIQYSISNIYVAHDDLDLKLGEYKIQFGKGPKDHNGVESVENALKTKEFWRIRIGIDNRTTPVDGETYVLQKFTPEEKIILENTLDAIVKAVNTNQESGRQK